MNISELFPFTVVVTVRIGNEEIQKDFGYWRSREDAESFCLSRNLDYRDAGLENNVSYGVIPALND